ncbi:hypothetical protein FHR32_003159 [Streptosporangium album]|uniref:RNA polymerase sigma-70 factor, ECF subfamily n=1 Tax=Streptosporangium album TaxID=47479 RepID=A0A7W7RV84_9ACTN|nr:hypothetical protein [Streptosporangium album]MBB4938854.1 hypothetical protein [Streptosporangium album]
MTAERRRIESGRAARPGSSAATGAEAASVMSLTGGTPRVVIAAETGPAGDRLDAMTKLDQFVASRPRLLGLAYRMLGEAAEADDVVSWADGGGKTTAAQRPVIGRARIMRYLSGLARHPKVTPLEMVIGSVNGEPALIARDAGTPTFVTVLELDGDRIVAVRTALNPDKLAFLAAQSM